MLFYKVYTYHTKYYNNTSLWRNHVCFIQLQWRGSGITHRER